MPATNEPVKIIPNVQGGSAYFGESYQKGIESAGTKTSMELCTPLQQSTTLNEISYSFPNTKMHAVQINPKQFCLHFKQSVVNTLESFAIVKNKHFSQLRFRPRSCRPSVGRNHRWKSGIPFFQADSPYTQVWRYWERKHDSLQHVSMWYLKLYLYYYEIEKCRKHQIVHSDCSNIVQSANWYSPIKSPLYPPDKLLVWVSCNELDQSCFELTGRKYTFRTGWSREPIRNNVTLSIYIGNKFFLRVYGPSHRHRSYRNFIQSPYG